MGADAVLLLILLVVSLAFLVRRTSRLRREIRDTESRLARRFYLLQGKVTELDSLVRELEFDRRRLRGEIRFEATTRLSDAFAVHPRVREILASFGISGSGCAGGSLDESRTIAEACGAASLDKDVVLEALARFVADPSAPVQKGTPSARIYRIQTRPGSSR